MLLVPLNADVPMQRVPWMNWLLMACILALSVFVLLDGTRYELTESEKEKIADHLEATQPVDLQAVNQYMTRPLTRDDVRWKPEDVPSYLRGPHSHPLALHPAAFHSWQLLTHALTHPGWIMLLANLLFLFCFGNAINAKLGHVTFLLVVAAFAILAALVMLLVGRPIPVLSSSCIILGIMGLFVVLYPRNDLSLYYWVWAGQRFNGICHLSAVWFIVGFLLLDVIYVWRKAIPVPLFVADICCLVSGILIGIVLVMTGLAAADEGEENLLQMMGSK